MSETTPLQLESLLACYQQADAEGTTLLVKHVNPILFRYYYGHTRNRQQSEDLLQEAWLRIHRARHTYRQGLPALPWLFAIAEHTRIDEYRRSRQSQNRELAMDCPPEPAHRAKAPFKAQVDWAGLLAKLPDSQREVLVLMKYSGLSLEDVARVKGSSIGAIKLRAHRAYDTLRIMLTKGKKEEAK